MRAARAELRELAARPTELIERQTSQAGQRMPSAPSGARPAKAKSLLAPNSVVWITTLCSCLWNSFEIKMMTMTALLYLSFVCHQTGLECKLLLLAILS